tara:strand:+ start:6015 stop:6968 length:954 start_codon:yes stop_codon:yes gene_type:complete
MAKRFIDTKIWDKAWFRKLTTKNKLLWIYILTKCDHAGIWDADWEAAEFFIGETVSFNDLPEIIQDKMNYIQGEDQYYIPSFIEFQYGVLKENSKPHLSVIKRLNDKGLLKGIDTLKSKNITPKDKDKNKDKDKVKEKDKKIREQEFKNKTLFIGLEVNDISEKQVDNFIDYWTESNENGKKMRFEMQKTFDIKRRLVKWKDNDKEWSIKKNPIKKIESEFAKVKSGMFYKAWCSKCGKKEMPSNKFDIQRGSSCCAVEYTNKPFQKAVDNIIATNKEDIIAYEEGTDYKGGGVDFESFKKQNPKARGMNHLSKYLK